MKVKRVLIKNVGKIADVQIPLDKPLILFFGDLCQGKTTILNAVKYVFGGSYPSDIIRHGADQASVSLEFEGGSISRSWYRAKDGRTVGRPVSFVRDGKVVERPVEEIKKFLNPYLLDNEYLARMGETERARYFTELFAVDTSDIDSELSALDEQAKTLRIQIKAYGEIDTKEVVLIDVESIKKDLLALKQADTQLAAKHKAKVDAILSSYLDDVDRIVDHNARVKKHNDTIEAVIDGIVAKREQIEHLLREIEQGENFLSMTRRQAFSLCPEEPEVPQSPSPSDYSELESKISQAEANKILFEAYQERLKKQAAKDADALNLKEVEARQKELRTAKIKRLKEVDTGGVADLEFHEDGGFTFEGTQASMLSTSQIMRLSGQLSALYPEGFGLELVDRAESLGKSIWDFVERAKRDATTILATIVGERPAEHPESVGVFVVENGNVK
jgi:DNA repair exonuclease SbcCD ATPase subunit